MGGDEPFTYQWLAISPFVSPERRLRCIGIADHEQHFERAAKLMSEVQAGKRKAYLAESVLAECIFIVTKVYKVPREEARPGSANFWTPKALPARTCPS